MNLKEQVFFPGFLGVGMVYKDLLLSVPQADRTASGTLSKGLSWRRSFGPWGDGAASRTSFGFIFVMQSLSIISPLLSDFQRITKINNYFSFTHVCFPLNIYLCYNVTSD